jgi:hypothetical protein
MAHSIGYFTASPQAENLVRLYGDRDLDKLPQVDQAALAVILSLYLYYENAYPGSVRNFELAALNAIHSDDDETTDDIQGALSCLAGVDRDGAIGILQFLVQ